MPLASAQPSLACRGPVPDENVGGKAAAPGDVAEPPCQFGRLVISSAKIALPVKRHRNNQTVLITRHHHKIACHQGCQELRQLQPVTMFEGEDQLALNVIVMKAAPDPRQRLWVHPADGAYGLGQRVAKRQAAVAADRCCNRREAAPAFATQAGAVGKAPAQHALMRQDKASEIACGARDETGCSDYPDRLAGPGKCGVNDLRLH